jgi:signal transduction histidine kinase
MRVRKKVLLLHTLFSLSLAAVLLVPLRPAITEVVEQAEVNEAKALLRLVLSQREAGAGATRPDLGQIIGDGRVRTGTTQELGLSDQVASQARAAPGRPVAAFVQGQEAGAVAYVPEDGGRFWSVAVRIPEARRAVMQLYVLTAAALLAVYALVAAALELFVLPQLVYGPIDRMLEAERAVQEGRKEAELIPDAVIPADELGEIMRTRNQSILSLRRHEQALAAALAELERVASDLRRKNHLLETARRNLADADRLASVGMMSAGIAHELNTPLAVLKGLVERLNADRNRRLDSAQAALMLRVVRRLERLGESLLDFARVRPPETRPVELRPLVDEAITLVRLDHATRGTELGNLVPETLVVECDGDRMVQVLVNLIRNAAEATKSVDRERPAGDAAGGDRIVVEAETSARDGRDWVSITVTDNGPGIHPDVLSRLFEPFASTRLDAHGTGLGLAVSEGIVREHGGVLLARNLPGRAGAVFEIMLPVHAAPTEPVSLEPVVTIRAAEPTPDL